MIVIIIIVAVGTVFLLAYRMTEDYCLSDEANKTDPTGACFDPREWCSERCKLNDDVFIGEITETACHCAGGIYIHDPMLGVGYQHKAF
jgi:hypothetical protein